MAYFLPIVSITEQQRKEIGKFDMKINGLARTILVLIFSLSVGTSAFATVIETETKYNHYIVNAFGNGAATSTWGQTVKYTCTNMVQKVVMKSTS